MTPAESGILRGGTGLAANVGLFGYWLYKVVRGRKNPLKEEVFTDLAAYKAIASERKQS